MRRLLDGGFLGRHAVFALSLLLAVVALGFVVTTGRGYAALALFGFLGALGIHDLAQRRHALLRNYPVIGHIRYLFETVRAELRQYLFEDDREALPFSREQRSLVYQRAKSEPDQRPFGTLIDVYGQGYEFMGHSVRPKPVSDPATFRVTIGNEQCAEPYDASVLNISGMSFGALSAAAIRALNKGAKLGGFSHDTGEGSVSPYHVEGGGDLVWQIASGYFGCRTATGAFDPEAFAARARSPQIRMIELKLSQGAKPGHGGILPADKVSPEIARVRGIPVGEACVSPSSHSSFDTPIGMMNFIAELRRLSGGKPVGVKLASSALDINNGIKQVMQVFTYNFGTEFVTKVRAELKAQGYKF